MLGRALVMAASMIATSGFLASASRNEPVLPREPLDRLPLVLGDWQGAPAASFDDRILAVLGVDDYIHRIYIGQGHAAVGLYVGYYQTQREGDTVHSPLNCLPGAGWEPIERTRIALPAAGTPESSPPLINRFVIRKGLDKQIVLYWYQSHGRIIASEYWGKAYLALDALRLNRTDGGLVRIISPVTESEEQAQADALAFANAMFPLLDRFLPD